MGSEEGSQAGSALKNEHFLIGFKHSGFTPEVSSPAAGERVKPRHVSIAGTSLQRCHRAHGLTYPWPVWQRPLDLAVRCFDAKERAPGVLVRFLKPGETAGINSIERLIAKTDWPA